jgi:hypothetical protein
VALETANLLELNPHLPLLGLKQRPDGRFALVHLQGYNAAIDRCQFHAFSPIGNLATGRQRRPPPTSLSSAVRLDLGLGWGAMPADLGWSRPRADPDSQFFGERT